MSNKFVWICCFAAALSVSSGAYGDDAAQPPAPEGEEFEQAALDYLSWCAPCHGRDANGNGPVASSLIVAPPDLTGLAGRAGGAFPPDEIKQRIDGRNNPSAHGTREMPVWGYWFNLEETAGGLLQEDREVSEKRVAERISRLVAYLEMIQK